MLKKLKAWNGKSTAKIRTESPVYGVSRDGDGARKNTRELQTEPRKGSRAPQAVRYSGSVSKVNVYGKVTVRRVSGCGKIGGTAGPDSDSSYGKA